MLLCEKINKEKQKLIFQHFIIYFVSFCGFFIFSIEWGEGRGDGIAYERIVRIKQVKYWHCFCAGKLKGHFDVTRHCVMLSKQKMNKNRCSFRGCVCEKNKLKWTFFCLFYTDHYQSFLERLMWAKAWYYNLIEMN